MSELVDRLRSTTYLDGKPGIEHEAADALASLELEVFAKDNAIANLGSLVDELRAEVEALRVELKKVRADRDTLLFEALLRGGR